MAAATEILVPLDELPSEALALGGVLVLVFVPLGASPAPAEVSFEICESTLGVAD